LKAVRIFYVARYILNDKQEKVFSPFQFGPDFDTKEKAEDYLATARKWLSLPTSSNVFPGYKGPPLPHVRFDYEVRERNPDEIIAPSVWVLDTSTWEWHEQRRA
jgi:hypothetical protein